MASRKRLTAKQLSYRQQTRRRFVGPQWARKAFASGEISKAELGLSIGQRRKFNRLLNSYLADAEGAQHRPLTALETKRVRRYLTQLVAGRPMSTAPNGILAQWLVVMDRRDEDWDFPVGATDAYLGR